MATVWILTVDNSPDPEAFADFHIAFTRYREHIEERTGGMDWDDEEFEWGDDTIQGRELYSCHCYGEFIARLHELEVQGG